MNRNKLRAVISTVLLICFVLVAATSAILYFNKTGMWLGIQRIVLTDIHYISGLIMLIFILVHLVINWAMYLKELKTIKKNKKDE